MFIDVHCHLDMLKNPEKIIDNAKSKGVGLIVANGTKPETNRKVIELSKFDEVLPALGVYPNEALLMRDSEIDEEIKFIRETKPSAIGEVGMDFVEYEDVNKQMEVFDRFIDLSKELEIPIIVHSRKAERECVDMLEKKEAKKVIMHYFSGKLNLLDKIVSNGWFLSIPTCVKNSQHFQQVIEKVPIESLLCETDSPYSHPDKEFPNEPANVIESYKKISEIKGISLEEVEKKLEDNFNRLFNRKIF